SWQAANRSATNGSATARASLGKIVGVCTRYLTPCRMRPAVDSAYTFDVDSTPGQIDVPIPIGTNDQLVPFQRNMPPAPPPTQMLLAALALMHERNWSGPSNPVWAVQAVPFQRSNTRTVRPAELTCVPTIQ